MDAVEITTTVHWDAEPIFVILRVALTLVDTSLTPSVSWRHWTKLLGAMAHDHCPLQRRRYGKLSQLQKRVMGDARGGNSGIHRRKTFASARIFMPAWWHAPP